MNTTTKSNLKSTQEKHKALTLSDAVPAIIALTLIAIVGSVALLILTNLQTNGVTVSTNPGVTGGGGGYGIYIQTGNFVNNGDLSSNGQSTVSGGNGG